MIASSPAGRPVRQEERPVPEAVLYRTAVSAADSVEGVPGCVAAAACTWSDTRLVRVGTSHAAAARLIEHQVRAGEGPTVEAARTGEVVTVPDARADRRWPAFVSLLERSGLCSLAVLPRRLSGGLTLTLSLYALRPGDLEPGRTAELLAEVAAARLRQAWLVAQGDDLRAALAGREPIEQAKGMIMQALGCDADEAFEQLRQYSQRRGVRLAELARTLVEEAGRVETGLEAEEL